MSEEWVVIAKSGETILSVDFLGLSLQLLADVKLLDAGPGELPAPDLVLPPVLVETVLGAVANLPAPGAPVGLEGVARTSVADPGIGQNIHQNPGPQALTQQASC